eukprot:SAG11_NODE_9007_length_954_cov_1.088889_1_plen_144_part_10
MAGLALVLLGALRADDGFCSTGLTVVGSPNAALNRDYYADTFSACGASSFVMKAMQRPESALRLSSSFLGSECAIGANQSCMWAIYDYPNQANLSARLHARCPSCPRPGQGCWGGGGGVQKWEVKTMAGEWAAAPAMEASCCTF